MTTILQTHLPFKPWSDPKLSRLPGLVPIEPGAWLQIDDAYASQMAYRQDLLATKPDVVLAQSDAAAPAGEELLERVLSELKTRPDFTVNSDHVTCPDGRVVVLNRTAPLHTLNALVQEDFCILEKPEGASEHVLTAGLLCFPASWTLAEKFMRPLVAIHGTVAEYDENIAKRVQRLFDGVQVARPIWRANCLVYADPDLHQPRRENQRRGPVPEGPKYVRIERQSIVKMAKTDAVIFSIHTYVVALDILPTDDQTVLNH